MSTVGASKGTSTSWPLIWEILLAVAFAVLVGVGVMTVVLPELADPPAESGPGAPGRPTTTAPGASAAGAPAQAPSQPITP